MTLKCTYLLIDLLTQNLLECTNRKQESPADARVTHDSSACVTQLARGVYKKLSYCWETVRRESMPRIAEMDVEMTT